MYPIEEDWDDQNWDNSTRWPVFELFISTIGVDCITSSTKGYGFKAVVRELYPDIDKDEVEKRARRCREQWRSRSSQLIEKYKRMKLESGSHRTPLDDIFDVPHQKKNDKLNREHKKLATSYNVNELKIIRKYLDAYIEYQEKLLSI